MKKIILCVLIFLTPLYSQNTTPNNENQEASIPEGYGDLTWGVPLSQAKDKVYGKLVFTDEKKVIITRDNDIQYYYGFFYKDPEITASVEGEGTSDPVQPTQPEEQVNSEEKDEGKLFYVSVKFPYVFMDDIFAKMTDKYKEPTYENINDNKGAIAWNSDKTVIIMWVDRFEDKPYCRRITYVSKDITGEVNDYTYKMLNKKIIEIIRDTQY